MRCVAAAALALACLPEGAGAAVGHDWPGRQLTRIELEGSNGYSILISSDRKQHLLLQTTKEGFTTEYRTRDALAGPYRTKATLPGLGSISVRFHPHGPARRPPAFAGCVGPRPTVRKGVVRGAIRFVGERDYTQAVTHEAPAEIEEWKSQRCRGGANPEQDGPNLEEWTSKFSAWRPGIEFLARKYRPGALEGGSRVLYLAETAEAASEFASFVIYRRATVLAPTLTFADAHPEHTIISPPPPFAGTGTFVRTPESVFAWEGDLSIQFPGTDPLPLTGPHFELDYCLREMGCIRQRLPPGDYFQSR
ncbi:MAG TPA: hypothetical protein VHQ43_12375 [Solirubrobacterales bacterium]|nr:hypothetical protein [Solirubrobacterales bacterium]